jgi:hypothetical protein
MSQIQNMRIADVNIAASGDNSVITAVAGQPIRIWQLFLFAAGAVNVKFTTATTPLNASAIPLTGAGSSIFFNYTGQEWFRSVIGQGFGINLSAAVQITGQVYYTLG